MKTASIQRRAISKIKSVSVMIDISPVNETSLQIKNYENLNLAIRGKLSRVINRNRTLLKGMNGNGLIKHC